MTQQSRWWPQKEEVVAKHGMVVAKHPLAAEAGLDVLKRGGNAIDAAVATGFAISVVEPMMSCTAGVGFMNIYLAQQGQHVVVEYPPRAPKAARPDMYRLTGRPGRQISVYEVEDDENIEGYRSIAVAGTVAGLCKAHERYGTLPLEQLMEPAIAYAADGFEVSWYLTLCITNAMRGFQRFPASSAVFLPHGRPPVSAPKPAEHLVQRDLAQVLRLIAKQGAAGFYQGDVAAAIEADMRAHDGLITRDDLAAYDAIVREPRRITYGDYEVSAAALPHGGTTMLQTLHILSQLDLRGLAHNSPTYLHRFIEAARHAFADRYFYLGDNDVVDVPLDGILSSHYAAALASDLDLRTTQFGPLEDTEPWVHYATHSLHDPWAYEGRSRAAAVPSLAADGDCTTHFGVVDNDRNLVSCTQTAVSLFGSRVVTPGLGLLWNNGMIWANPKPGAANSIAPWKRPLTNMAPLIALKNGAPALSIGAPGGRRIMNCNAQVFLNVAQFGMGMQEAIAQPRVDASTKDVLVDNRMPPETIEALAAMGHPLSVVEETAADLNFATPLGILVNHERGTLHSGVDVFRIAEARGY
ncbi:MAG: hypothetical protein ETSY1_13055 [Candidatus Entotheonella factor]|uniref:Glutathione hydrolase proenzyme n=1 Tax=Entotheonella factor TaxID=1429438 RepID=W4LPF2_ENTF1|nr:MAG: hypothetical protein ETSY1_13055 [Candidatus Entotheonella factor]